VTLTTRKRKKKRKKEKKKKKDLLEKAGGTGKVEVVIRK
jgi:hypothetical protein